MILDIGLLDIDNEDVKTIPDVEFLRTKKNLLIKQCIQKYCKEDFGLVDLFSNGYVTELGLAMNKEVICLVETIEDQRNMGTRLLDFTKPRNEHPASPPTNNQENTMGGSRHGAVRTAQDFLDFEDSM